MSKITKTEVFDIEIKGVVHEGFKKKDSWNGLACYENKYGKIIAAENFKLDIFSFMNYDNINEEDIKIVAGSPCFNL